MKTQKQETHARKNYCVINKLKFQAFFPESKKNMKPVILKSIVAFAMASLLTVHVKAQDESSAKNKVRWGIRLDLLGSHYYGGETMPGVDFKKGRHLVHVAVMFSLSDRIEQNRLMGPYAAYRFFLRQPGHLFSPYLSAAFHGGKSDRRIDYTAMEPGDVPGANVVLIDAEQHEKNRYLIGSPGAGFELNFGKYFYCDLNIGMAFCDQEKIYTQVYHNNTTYTPPVPYSKHESFTAEMEGKIGVGLRF